MRSAHVSSLLAIAALAIGILAAAPSGRAQTLQKSALIVDGNGNGLFEVDETIQYTLTFTNTTPNDITGAVIHDDSSGCLAIDTGSVVIEPTGGGTNSSGVSTVQVDLASPLPPGEAVIITFVASATAVGDCCNQATWTAIGLPGGVSDLDPSDGTIDQPTCHLVSQSPGPDFDAVIDKQVLSAGCLSPGSTVEFRIRIQNVGRRPLRNVAFNDVLDAGFGSVVVDGGLSYDPATNRVFVDPRTYGVGEETGYTYRAVIPCTASGTLYNTGQLTFEDNDGNVFVRSDTETVTWGQPDMGDSTKTWAEDPTDGDGFVSPGETVSFAITIRNSGACEALNVAVSDDLDGRFLNSAPPLAISDGGFYDATTARIEWNETTTPALAAIPVGASVTLTFTTQVDPATTEGEFLPNSVTIAPLGSISSCPGVPSVTRTIAMQNGDVAYGSGVPTTVLLRNDFVSCRSSAFRTMAGGGPSGPILRMRPFPQECSAPSAIVTGHPQTDVIVNPLSPHVVADATWTNEQCPQIWTGSGHVLVFYELDDDCTHLLRVTKDLARPWAVILTW